jgi:hypothetical protein
MPIYQVKGTLNYNESEETDDGNKTIEIDDYVTVDPEETDFCKILYLFLDEHPEYDFFGSLRTTDYKTWARFFDSNEGHEIIITRQ